MRRVLACLMTAAGLVLSGCGTEGQRDNAESDRPPARANLAVDEPSVTVVAVGDIACPPGSTVTSTKCQHEATAKAARALSPENVITLGDHQYEDGAYDDFTDSYANSWGELRPITFPVAGNHEYHTSGADGYYRYFADRQPGSPGYYRETLNGWQLYLLNSNCSDVDCSAQLEWLEAQMTANPSTCSLIAMHHPRFSSGDVHGSSAEMKPFWEVAYRHNADIALAGHDHDYERFAPMDPDGDVEPDRGIQQFVSGAGGRSLYPKGETVPGSEKFINTEFGVLELSLRPSGYSWNFRDTSLGVRDSGSATCR